MNSKFLQIKNVFASLLLLIFFAFNASAQFQVELEKTKRELEVCAIPNTQFIEMKESDVKSSGESIKSYTPPPAEFFENRLNTTNVTTTNVTYTGFPSEAQVATLVAAVYTITGIIKDTDNNPMSDVTVRLTGNVSRTTTTNTIGAYTFSDLPENGYYMVTPSRINYKFNPSSKTFNSLSSNQIADFTGTIVSSYYNITGTIKDLDNNPMSGVTVTLSGDDSQTTTTDITGDYTFSDLSAGGNYTVTPSQTNYWFDPPSRIFYGLSSDQIADFTGKAFTYNITGTIKDKDGIAISDVGVTLILQPLYNIYRTTTTNTYGSYTFLDLSSIDTWIVQPSKTNYIFNPTNRTFNGLNSNQIADFIGTIAALNITGTIRDASNNPMSGVTVTLSGDASKTTTTNTTGAYTFSNLPEGGYYIVIPSRTNYTFNPIGRTFNGLYSSQTANFTGTYVAPHTITGTIKDTSNNPISGVTVTLTGGASRTTTTNTTGTYTFADLPAGSDYTIVVSRINYLFTPNNQTINGLSSDRIVDFVGAFTSIYYNITGTIKDASNNPISSVTVTLTGDASNTTTTYTNGTYIFSDLSIGGNYTVTPEKTNYKFNPSSKTFNGLSSNQTADFIGAIAAYTITGTIRDASNNPISGVTVTLIGDVSPRTTTTNTTGVYTFSDLSDEGYYIVTPSKTNYSFNPNYRTFNGLSSNQTANFTGIFVVSNYYNITGTIKDANNNPISGVTITLAGDSSKTTTTNNNGTYTFSDLSAGGNYTITPSKTNYTFNPSSRTFTGLNSNQTADFTGTIVAYNITGTIKDAGNNPMSGVTVALTGDVSQITTSSINGTYIFSDLFEWGYYTVTPSKTNYTFNPSQFMFYGLSSGQTANFIGTVISYNITGTIKDADNNPVSGVTVTLTGGDSKTTTTNSTGAYTFSDLSVGSNYTVTPSKTNYTFDPSNIIFTSLNSNQTADFIGTVITYHITGTIKDANNNPISDVTVTLTGDSSKTTTTNITGAYTFSDVPAGGNYTVTPSKTNYTFNPSNRTFTGLSSNQTADFISTVIIYSITGTIKDADNNPMSGIMVTLTGDASKTTTTNTTGAYIFSDVPAGGNYMVTPSRTNYSFSPSNKTFIGLNSDQTADFVGTGDPGIYVLPTVINFGEMTTYQEQIRILNTGVIDLMITSLQITGADSLLFSIIDQPSLPLTITPNNSIFITVRFRPINTTGKNATLSIINNATNTDVILTGIGIPATILTSDSVINFDNTDVGKSSVKSVLITSKGNAMLTLSGIKLNGYENIFSISGPSFPIELNPNLQCNINITFKPTEGTTYNSVLSISSSDIATPQKNIVLVGVGISPNMILSQAVDFGQVVSGTSKERVFRILNSGNATLTISGINITGNNTNEFLIKLNKTLPYNIMGTQSDSVLVQFNPNIIGVKSAKIIVTSNDKNAINEIPIIAEAVEVISVDNKDMLPTSYSLEQNYPNPFNPSTKIKYAIKEAGFVSIQVFDIFGREVKQLVNTFQTSGNYEITFDAMNLTSGIYYYKLNINNFTETKKMVLMK